MNPTHKEIQRKNDKRVDAWLGHVSKTANRQSRILTLSFLSCFLPLVALDTQNQVSESWKSISCFFAATLLMGLSFRSGFTRKALAATFQERPQASNDNGYQPLAHYEQEIRTLLRQKDPETLRKKFMNLSLSEASQMASIAGALAVSSQWVGGDATARVFFAFAFLKTTIESNMWNDVALYSSQQRMENASRSFTKKQAELSQPAPGHG